MAAQSRSPKWLSPAAVAFALRGLVGMGVGVAAAAGMGRTSEGAASLFLVYLFADAVPVLFLSLLLNRRCLLVSGIASISIGTLLLFAESLSVYALTAVVGFWAMLTGLLGLLGAGALRQGTMERVLFGSAGGLSVLLGTYLGLFPHSPPAILVFLLGIFGSVTGICFLLLAHRLRGEGPGATYRAQRLA